MSASKSKLGSLIASALTVLLVASGADAGGGGAVPAPHLSVAPRHLTVTNAPTKVSDDANVHDGAQIILFVQHAPPTGYDPDYFKTPRQGVHIELELILE